MLSRFWKKEKQEDKKSQTPKGLTQDNKRDIASYAMWIGLALALLSSIQHIAAVAMLFETVWIFGWFIALTIDVTIFSLALSIQKRSRAGRDTRLQWVFLVLVSVISGVVNFYHNLLTSGHVTKLADIGHVDWLNIILAFVLGGLLPLIVVILGHIISSDDDYWLQQKQIQDQKEAEKQEREARKQDKLIETQRLQAEAELEKAKIEQTRVEVKPQKTFKMTPIKQQALEILKANPLITNAELGSQIGKDGETARGYRKALLDAGLLSTNGNHPISQN